MSLLEDCDPNKQISVTLQFIQRFYQMHTQYFQLPDFPLFLSKSTLYNGFTARKQRMVTPTFYCIFGIPHAQVLPVPSLKKI